MDETADTHTQTARPASGRILLRRTAQGSLLAGVLHLPPSLTVQEGSPYRLSVHEGQLVISVAALAEVKPAVLQEAVPFGADAMLEADIWHPDDHVGQHTVRFLKAFEPNGWVVLGASAHPLIPVNAAGQMGDVWLDVQDGQITEYALSRLEHRSAASCARSIGQVLRSLVAWPNAQGVLHTLPVHVSTYRPHYLRKADLEARLGAGLISEREFMAAVRADPSLLQICPPVLPEPRYLEFISVIKNFGGLEIERPLNRAEFRNKANMYNLAYRSVSQARVERMRPQG